MMTCFHVLVFGLQRALRPYIVVAVGNASEALKLGRVSPLATAGAYHLLTIIHTFLKPHLTGLKPLYYH
jgi:hypothetical protein